MRLTTTRKDVLIRVTDAGPGSRRTSGSASSSRSTASPGGPDEPGAGLGLAIARGFAEANGGRLWLETREGQGASFVLALPLVELPAPVTA